MNGLIFLKSSEGQRIQIDTKSAEGSKVLKKFMETAHEGSELSLPEIKISVLKVLVDYMKHYKEKDPKEIPMPFPYENLDGVIDQWDINFINEFSMDALYELLIASHKMKIQSLSDLIAAKFAIMLNNKSIAQIKELLNIDCDLTEEDLNLIKNFEII
ncbi:MAG: hypothetical protein MJ252_14550 [archaeon]|nr:hypothetical protein [archaeon]